MENINCNKHGIKNIVLCCKHLTKNNLDTIYLVPEEGEEEATVWCKTCETARIKDKGWYDYADSIANWKIICASCLDEKVKNANHVYDLVGSRTPT